MTHEHGIQQWVVGSVETDTNSLGIDIIPERNHKNLKIFINNHIDPGTIIVTDAWRKFQFLNNDDTSVLEHQIYHQREGDLGIGRYSISHIKHIWSNLKQEMNLL